MKVCACSGGMDWRDERYWARAHHWGGWGDVARRLPRFDKATSHNQRGNPMRRRARRERFGRRHRTIPHGFIGKFSSTLLQRGGMFTRGHYAAEHNYKQTGVPFRKTESCWRPPPGLPRSTGAGGMVIASAHEEDHKISPDCASDFMRARAKGERGRRPTPAIQICGRFHSTHPRDRSKPGRPPSVWTFPG